MAIASLVLIVVIHSCNGPKCCELVSALGASSSSAVAVTEMKTLWWCIIFLKSCHVLNIVVSYAIPRIINNPRFQRLKS